MFNRIFLVILDSVGIGEAHDADEYGDKGANTLGNIAKATGGLNLPNMEKLGLGNIADIEGIRKVDRSEAYYTKATELSRGKDTITGHWEIVGLHIDKPFQVFTDTGFPQSLIDELEEKTGHKFIGNIAASGTAILDELGEEHIKTKSLILYTSADSVLQIAANEEIIPLEELYRVCEIAREITLKEEYKVARVIARPFIGSAKGSFIRTANRHDYALKPFDNTILDEISSRGYEVVGIGKISDIYCNQGITKSIKTKNNDMGMQEIIHIAKEEDYKGLIFLNLVDFDSVYGHRRNPFGYKEALERFDIQLKDLIEELKDDDLLIITADHGNDPTFKGTDHTREYVPVIVYGKELKEPKKLHELKTMADIGATINDNFSNRDENSSLKIGNSFLNDIK